MVPTGTSPLSFPSRRLPHPQHSAEQATQSSDLPPVLEQEEASSSIETSSSYSSPARHNAPTARRNIFAPPDSSDTPKLRPFSPTAGHTRVSTSNSSTLVTVLPFSPLSVRGLASWQRGRADTQHTTILLPPDRIMPSYGSITNNNNQIIDQQINEICKYIVTLLLATAITVSLVLLIILPII